MNYMGNQGMIGTDSNDSGGYQPASRSLTPDQRMYMQNHPDSTVTWSNKNNYRHGSCMNNSGMSMGMNNSMMHNGNMSNGMMNDAQNSWANQGMNANNGMMPGNQSNMMTNAPSGNTISLRPETMTNTDFLPAYLRQFIGRWVRCEFFIGDTVEQRVGVLHDVGASYIIIDVIEPQTLVVCDIFSLRFVTIVLDEEYGRLLKV